MAALPVGMQLVSALDGVDAAALDVEMDIDMDVFRPSAMMDAEGLFFGSSFQPDLGEADQDIEQMLLCGAEEAALQSHHQHETAPGQGCQCRNFAILANQVHTPQERVAVDSVAKDQKKVLRHTFGSGKRLQGFGFGENAVRDQNQQQVDGRAFLLAESEMEVKKEGFTVEAMNQMIPDPFEAVKTEVPSTPERVLHKSHSVEGVDMFTSPLHRSRSMSAVTSPLCTSFVSLENMMTTPLSTMSRSTAHPEMPVMMRSLSPADEMEKMAASGSKTSMPKMNMLRGNFQVSPGHETVPLVKPTAVLPPPYFREALDSPKKRRAHSKTFNSFAQSLSFSFSNDSFTDE